MRLPVEPILLEPHFEEKVWGGNKLKTLLNKKIPEDVIIGESWEVSAIEKKESYVVEGQLSGENLRSLYKKFPEEILGKNHKKYPKFPLLIKFIDAKEKLSIQVHPKSSSSEKNECWFIVSPGEKGAISTGFNKKVDKKEVLSALSFKKIEELLNVVRVKEEEVYFIPAGTIHAILEDVLIYEIQQSSNITFRLYDWDRNSTISKQRALHIKEALEEIEFSDKKDFLVPPYQVINNNFYSQLLRISCNYFKVEEYIFHKNSVPVSFVESDSVKIITAISGSFIVEWAGKAKEIYVGNTILLPAVLSQFNIVGSEKCRIIVSTIP